VDIGSTSTNPNNITLGGAGDFVINGSVFNNGVGVRGLTKTGSGALTLAASNNYNGVTTISGGTLRISNSFALGTAGNGTTVADGAALELIGGITVGAEELNLNGTGLSSGGALRNISGDNTYGGTITNTLASRINSDAGLLTLSGAINANSQALTFGGAGNITVSGAITNSTSTLTKDGAGTLTLSAANSYDGVTTVSAGALTISNGSALGSATAGTTVSAGAALQLQGGITIDGETLGLSGTNGDTASLRNISGNNTYNGAITFNNNSTNRIDSDAGLLTLSSFANTLNASRSLLVGGAGNTVFTGRFTGTSTGTMTKDGTGTLTLSATNFDIAGGVIVNAGTLALGTNDALGATRAITVNNATFDLGSYSNTMGAVTVTNGGRITNGTLTASSIISAAVGKTNTISANLAGSGGLALTGNTNTTVLSGSNSYSGDTTLQTANSTNMTLRVTTTDALSSNSSLVGSSSAARIPTLELAAAGDYKMQNFNGGNMIFLATNGAATLSFTNTSVTNDMVGGDRSFYATNVDVSLAGAFDVSATTADKEFRFFGDGDYTFNGSILTTNNTFTSSMLVGTTGTVTLNASNNYNGTTTVNSNATLLLGDNNALGTTNSGTTVVSGGALDLGGSAISDEALSVEGTGVSSGGAIKNSSASAASFSGPLTLTAATTIATTNGNITLSGAIGQDTGSRNLTKTGSSTLTLSGTSANTYLGRTTVSGGVLELNKTAGVNAIAGAVTVNSSATLLLSANNQVADASTITLSGGTIQRASGVSETFGALDLTAPSFLNFGTGDTGTLSFGTYAPSALLTVQNFLPGNTLTFGSNLTSTINNSTLFAFSGGFTSSWNDGTSTFTITAIPEPSTYVAAIALLGLMLWPSRRRLLKDAKSILGLRAPTRDRLQVHGKA
jgi:autotransporter-associated beta strand protein